MPWNEPGKDKDPWGQRNDNGPPDLDEVLNNLKKKFNGILGGHGLGLAADFALIGFSRATLTEKIPVLCPYSDTLSGFTLWWVKGVRRDAECHCISSEGCRTTGAPVQQGCEDAVCAYQADNADRASCRATADHRDDCENR